MILEMTNAKESDRDVWEIIMIFFNETMSSLIGAYIDTNEQGVPIVRKGQPWIK